MKETLRDQLARMNTPEVCTKLASLTRNELFKASKDHELWAYETLIKNEAARRYFQGK